MTKILDNIGRNENGDKLPKPVAPTAQWNKFIDDMVWNNTYCPEPTRIIYNIGKKAYPILENGKHVKDETGKLKYGDPVKILTTIVFFDDGTKVIVSNSEHDGVTFETVHSVPGDENSPMVEVATDLSKENGFVYATVKRLMGYPDSNGTIIGDGFGRRLRDLVSLSYDAGQQAVANKYKEKIAKAKYESAKGTSKPTRPSFAETVVDLRAATDNLKEMIKILKADVDSIKASN